MKLLSSVKNTFVTDACETRKVICGPFRGLSMNLSLRTQAQVYLGLFERETYPWIRLFSKDIQTAVDVGAAHGEYTLFFASRTSAKKIYAFEPDQKCLSAFRDNLALNCTNDSINRIITCPVFVGNSDEANTVTLDSLTDSIRTPCFVKVDVDGGEEAVLSGAKHLNSLRDVRWLIETHSKNLENICIKILRDAGFETEVVKNAWWRSLIPEQRPSEHNRWLTAWKI